MKGHVKQKTLLPEKRIISQHPLKISVREASTVMGVTPRFLQMALQQGKFPFGVGVQMGKWAYYINGNRFKEYMRLQKET